MGKYERDVEAVMTVLSKSSNGLLMVQCAIRAQMSHFDIGYVLKALVEDRLIVKTLTSKLDVPVYHAKRN